MMKDILTKAVTTNGFIRIYAVNSRNTVEEARKLHMTMPLGTAALGRLLSGGLLVGAMTKDENTGLTLQLKGDGPLGRVLVVADCRGGVKGYVENPLVQLPLNESGKLDVGGGIGKNGYMSIVKDMKLKEPYVGQVPIQTGEIGDDLAFYFAQSEQIPSVVGLGVLVDTDYTVKQAGGFIVQVMPDCDESSLNKLENTARSIKSVTSMLDKGMNTRDIIKEVMEGFDVEFLEETEVEYSCDCCDERMTRAITSLGKKEIQAIIDEQGEAEIVCQFCNKAYKYNREQLIKMLSKAKRS